MKYAVIFLSIALMTTTNAYAGCIGTVVNGNCLGSYIDNPYVGSNNNRSEQSQMPSEHRYSGSSGSSYQYDRNDPSDQLRYSTDMGAQRRDQLNNNLNQKLDRGLGQNGGGIYDDLGEGEQ